MGDIVGINGQKPESIIEDQAFDNYIGCCLVGLICGWCGGVDDEIEGFIGTEMLKGLHFAYENDPDMSTDNGKNELLEMTDDIRRLKDALREVMIQFKNETEGAF